MIKEAEVNGKTYEIDTTPERYHFVQIVKFELHDDTSGVFAQAMAEVAGKPMQIKHRYLISEEEEIEVIVALGRKFSTSKAWKISFDWAYRKMNSKGEVK